LFIKIVLIRNTLILESIEFRRDFVPPILGGT